MPLKHPMPQKTTICVMLLYSYLAHAVRLLSFSDPAIRESVSWLFLLIDLSSALDSLYCVAFKTKQLQLLTVWHA